MALTETDVMSWRGQTLVDGNGDKIGKIEEIYLDAETDVPEWALVTTGMFGTKQSFVPIQDATSSDDGNASASRSPSRPSRTRRRSIPTAACPTRKRPTSTALRPRLPAAARHEQPAGDGRDLSGPDTDDAMTRSEEELRVGTTEREPAACA